MLGCIERMDYKSKSIVLFLVLCCAFAAFADSPMVTVPPLHDWTIHTPTGVWGIQGYARCTFIVYGSEHYMIRLPFYAFVGLPSVLFATMCVLGLRWLRRKKISDESKTA